MKQYQSLTQARAERDGFLAQAVADGDLSEEQAEVWCQAPANISQLVDHAQKQAEQHWIRMGCSGLPGWQYLDELRDCILWIAAKEKEALVGVK